MKVKKILFVQWYKDSNMFGVALFDKFCYTNVFGFEVL